MIDFASVVTAILVGVFACSIVYSALEPPSSPSTVSALPPAVDLSSRFRNWHLEPRCQGKRGTCSVFAVVGALEYAVASRQRAGTRLSVEFLNWAGHQAAHRTADGGFFSELWKGYEAFGICTEDDLPYRSEYDAALQPPEPVVERGKGLRELGLRMHWIKEWNPHTGLTDEQLHEIKATLSKEWPVCGGFRWPKQAKWERDVLQLCPPEEVFDGHSVLLIGYRDDEAQPGGGVFLIRNSGGDGRDGYLPYAYVREYMNDAIWIEAASNGKKTTHR